MPGRNFDTIVIGGGLVGAAIAWGLVAEGQRVALMDEGDVALRASRGNFGLVWVQSKGLGAPWYQRWTRASASAWPAFRDDLLARTGLDPALEQPGGVHLCLTEEEYADRALRMEQMQAEAGNHGYDYRMIRRDELQSMLPPLGPDVVGASWTPYDGHANPLLLLRGLHRAFTDAGGVYLPNSAVAAARVAPRDFSLAHPDGDLRAPCVVLAAGLGNAALAPLFGLVAPVRPQRGQILVTERTTRNFSMPTTTVRQTTEGSLMLGDSMEEVGPNLAQKPDVMAAIARRAVASFPWLSDLSIVRAWSALRVMAPDGLPIYDQSTRYPGAFTANCHSGVTLAGAHACLLAPMIARGSLDLAMAPFSAHRFAARDAPGA